MESSYLAPPEKVLAFFSVDEARGLSDERVLAARKRYGPNSLPEEPPTPLWQLVLDQFKDQLVIILLASAALSFVLALFDDSEDGWTAFVDPLVILTILVFNALVGISQESSAEKAISALQEYSASEAKVLRDGVKKRVKAEDLVPGDIVSISVGDRVPADCRLLNIASTSFRVDQAILTGESKSVNKTTATVTHADAVKQEQVDMVFSGTTVVVGNATAIVVATGSRTAIGDIQESITSQIDETTPLKEKLNQFGDALAKVISVICLLVWVINIRHFNDPTHGGITRGAIYYLKIAVSLGVAAIPEGLAVVITTCLALGTRKMAKKNAIVRNLPSVETLGSCDVICSDKTGTLTTNQMNAHVIAFMNGTGTGLEMFDVEGSTFAPEGKICERTTGREIGDIAARSRTMAEMTRVMALCNQATLAHDTKTDAFSVVGEPTEGALRALVEKIGTPLIHVNEKIRQNPITDATRLHGASAWFEKHMPVDAVYEFSRDRKSMSVLVNRGTIPRLLVKGAPESIIERCSHIFCGNDAVATPLEPTHAELLMDEMKKLAGNHGSRIMAIASAEPENTSLLLSANTPKQYLALEQEMTLIGFVGILDPPRPQVRSAIAACHDAGIRVLVITGDNKATAEAICRKVGVLREDEDATGKSMTGREFDALDERSMVQAAKNVRLLSRTEPVHKSHLVDLLQSLGHTVAMTGDGVNDAPALKKADIGIAMGSGTDVAKLASAMVLGDNNFATIEAAIEEGRSIFENTQQFIRYLISSNIGEVVSIFLTAALGMPEALVPVQLLWVNLVTDGLPATALSFNPLDQQVMKRKPRNRNEPLVSKWLFFRYMVIGIYVGCATVAGYAWWFMFYEDGPKVDFYQLTHFHSCNSFSSPIDCSIFSPSSSSSRTASTISLSILVLIEMLNAANALSSSASLLTFPIWRNLYLVGAIALSLALHFAIVYVPFLGALFGVVPLNLAEWSAVWWISLPVIAIDEGLKAVERLSL